MAKEITGTIPYKFMISDTGEWTIEYGYGVIEPRDHIHNDMASLAIAQRVMEICAIRIREEKKDSKGIVRKHLSQKLNKAIDGRFGLKVICDYLLDCYKPYMKYLKEYEANISAEQAKEQYKTNNKADEI